MTTSCPHNSPLPECLAWFPVAEDVCQPGANGPVATGSQDTLTCLLPRLSTDFTPIAQHKSWKELQRLPNPTLHFTDTNTGAHRRERLGQGHAAHWFKGRGENCPTGDSPCVSSFSQPVLLLSTLAGFQTLDTRSTPSRDVPAACQSVSPEVNNPSWPGALYLQGNEKCKHCVGFREMLWSIHHCVSAKSVMLTSKQCLHIVYDLWDFSALLPYNFQLASNENFSTPPPSFDVTADIYLGDTGHLPFAKLYAGFGDTRMRRYYGGCFHIVTGLGVKSYRHTETVTGKRMGRPDSSSLSPFFSSSSPAPSPLLLASVSCASSF